MNNSKLKRFHLIMKPKLYFILSLALFFRLPGFDAVLVGDELAMVSIWGQMPYEKIFQNYQYPNNHILLTIILSFLLKGTSKNDDVRGDLSLSLFYPVPSH